MKRNFDIKAIKKMVKDFESEERIREEVIRLSREMIKESKQIIYALHRTSNQKNKTNKNEINKLLNDIESKKRQLLKIIKVLNPDTNISSTAFQEYGEAVCFNDFMNRKKIKTASQLGITSNEYIAALCDLTGELGRYCVIKSIRKDIKEVERAKSLIEDIMGLILEFDFRNGELRKKADAVKWNLKKAEEVLFDLSIGDGKFGGKK